jgi:uncharacterized protein (TIGR00251 family)
LIAPPNLFENILIEACSMYGIMSAESIWESERGTFIRVVVKPGSKSGRFVEEITPEAVFLNLSGPAREGKANTELIKKMAKLLDVSTANVVFVAGHKSREKTLLVIGRTREEILQKVSSMI